jgi:hypothetical protein
MSIALWALLISVLALAAAALSAVYTFRQARATEEIQRNGLMSLFNERMMNIKNEYDAIHQEVGRETRNGLDAVRWLIQIDGETALYNNLKSRSSARKFEHCVKRLSALVDDFTSLDNADVLTVKQPIKDFYDCYVKEFTDIIYKRRGSLTGLPNLHIFTEFHDKMQRTI